MDAARDDEYLGILTTYIRVCERYRPRMGQGVKAGYSLDDFRKLYHADPFYNWLGLDNPLMYAAHKAAGGMTSIYRQIGIGCEALYRRILQDTLGLTDESVRWSYTLPKLGGKTRTLSLDARIPIDEVRNVPRRRAIRQWLKDAAFQMEIDPKITASLTGIVFEIRQGYKSKDSKRQNADIANAATAYTRGLLPCAAILSLQIDQDIATRYKNERWVVLTGLTSSASPHESVYAFTKDIVGYNLAAFFERNSDVLRSEVDRVLTALLKAE